ncbi:hypothetical protein AJ79_05011 [Helicocarpus griseus UAMH5409]|uniref:PRISE-like Rossmann-fold domain-containing protein n=1 Tax=Helicocarpus griseus UAMH5409 TaxID=1447875 RepID=A0A2B7XQD0_9EURO|nr:hypothetical protein AJ79_05011 [Helicocarpus griseus UAMH5409]
MPDTTTSSTLPFPSLWRFLKHKLPSFIPSIDRSIRATKTGPKTLGPQASSQQPQQHLTVIQSKGIYHGLPVFPESEDRKGLTAIVTGANGLSGSHMVRVLAESPERWANVYALSRRAPVVKEGTYANVKHIEMDFLKTEPEKLAKELVERGVKADYIFFYSYIQVPPKDEGSIWSDAQELCNANGVLLFNFLKALKLASVTPKRFMLQTGAKHYGMHLGTARTPQLESAPRVNIEPNFYYGQEDLLIQYCQETGAEWNVIRPSFILGAAKDAAMNLAYSLGVFAAVHAHLKKPLVFHGNVAAFDAIRDLSSAMLDGYLAEWAVLKPDAANEAFNACDCSAVTSGMLWTRLAEIYGVEYQVPDPKAEYQILTMPCDPPRGFGFPEKIEFTYSMAAWAYDPLVHNAWQELTEKHGLIQNPFTTPAERNRIFGLADTALLGGTPVQFSMDKSRKLGWHGTVNSFESLRSVLEELVEMKMLPPLPSSDSTA